MADLLRTKRSAWAFIFALVTAVAALSYFYGTRYLAAVRAVEHTLAIASAIQETLSLLKDAETGERGYILTGDMVYLEPYGGAHDAVRPLLARLATLTRADPSQQALLATLHRLIDAKFAFMEETVRLRRVGEAEQALARVRSGVGKRIMDQVRAESARMLQHEEQSLALRRYEASEAERAALWGVGVGSVLTILLALASFLTVDRDVDTLQRSAEELARSEEYYRLLTEQSSDLVRLLSLDGRVIYVSPSVQRILGYEVDEYMKLAPRSLMHPDELSIAADILSDIRGSTMREGVSTYRLLHKSGEYRWFEVRWAARRDAHGTLLDIHTAGRDVTERREAEQQLNAYADALRNLSIRDDLTGLYNRRGFLEVAGHAHSQALREQRCAALVFIDLDGMKRINDEQGHDVGDLALSDTAHVLQAAMRGADVVARLGGDEFVVYALDFTTHDIEPLRARLIQGAEQRVNAKARSYRLLMSTGAAYLEKGSRVELVTLLEQADAAMYAQKQARKAGSGAERAGVVRTGLAISAPSGGARG
jgi:diguanylate cyclase (GGDEF)-like protein/PAS domain S-box-containing protein